MKCRQHYEVILSVETKFIQIFLLWSPLLRNDNLSNTPYITPSAAGGTVPRIKLIAYIDTNKFTKKTVILIL